MAKKKVKAGAAQSPSEVAFYYPGPMWFSGDALKNLLLFFDGIALLVPRYMLDHAQSAESLGWSAHCGRQGSFISSSQRPSWTRQQLRISRLQSSAWSNPAMMRPAEVKDFVQRDGSEVGRYCLKVEGDDPTCRSRHPVRQS